MTSHPDTAIAEAPKTISSLCVELLRDCRDRLLAPESLNDDELVHDLRVATKRLRAAWRLVKELARSGLARKRRKALKALSAHLSFRRDVAVLEELTRNLAASQTDTGAAQLLEKIGDSIAQLPTHSALQPCPEGLFEEVCAALDEEIAAWEGIDWSNKGHARKAIRRTLHKTSSRARRNTRAALGDNAPHIWHEWRKAIKQLRYQREFVAEASGRIPGKFDDRISRLGTALGQRNDLANLAAFVEREAKSGGFDSDDPEKLKPVIALAERDLLRNCRRLGRKFLRKG